MDTDPRRTTTRAMTTQRPRALLPVWLALGLTATACEAPEGLSADRPYPPYLDAIDFVVGVTASGEGRAKIPLGTSIYQGVVGTRAYLSTDGFVTQTRVPVRRVNNEPNFLLLDGLTAGTTYQVKGVVVNNVGIESEANEEGPQELVVPAAKLDDEAPEPTTMTVVEDYGDAVAVRWYAGYDADVYQYVIERSLNGGAFSPLGAPIKDSTAPHVNDATATAPGTYAYRVVVEDLSGNLSAASDALSITID